MRLWTYHPSALRLDNPPQRLDHTLGEFWNDSKTSDRYRLVLLLLQQRLVTDQFLWCETARGHRFHYKDDEVEWELTVPPSRVITFYWVAEWEAILWGTGGSWDKLFLPSPPQYGSKEIGALVPFPPEREWVRCLGKPERRTIIVS
jgi:hypothetical protein